MPSRLGYGLYKKNDRLKIFIVVYSIIKINENYFQSDYLLTYIYTVVQKVYNRISLMHFATYSAQDWSEL